MDLVRLFLRKCLRIFKRASHFAPLPGLTPSELPCSNSCPSSSSLAYLSIRYIEVTNAREIILLIIMFISIRSISFSLSTIYLTERKNGSWHVDS